MVDSAGAGEVWPKKPGSRKVAGDTLWDVRNPLHPAPANSRVARASLLACLPVNNCTQPY